MGWSNIRRICLRDHYLWTHKAWYLLHWRLWKLAKLQAPQAYLLNCSEKALQHLKMLLFIKSIFHMTRSIHTSQTGTKGKVTMQKEGITDSFWLFYWLLDQMLKVTERELALIIHNQIHIDSMQFGLGTRHGTTGHRKSVSLRISKSSMVANEKIRC